MNLLSTDSQITLSITITLTPEEAHEIYTKLNINPDTQTSKPMKDFLNLMDRVRNARVDI